MGKPETHSIEKAEGIVGSLALPSAVTGDEEALHSGAQRVRTLPHRPLKKKTPVGTLIQHLLSPPLTRSPTEAETIVKQQHKTARTEGESRRENKQRKLNPG